jgi:hypothetical protein
MEKMQNEWVLREKSILSFHNLRNNEWGIFCDKGTVEEFDTEEWALSKDEDNKKIFVQLLNRCLESRLRRHYCSYRKQSECYCIWATKDKSARYFKYASRLNETGREIFGPHESKKIEGRIAYYRHSAFIGHFKRIEQKWYLEINPTYVFTSDGFQESNYSAERLSTMRRIERNDAVFGQVIMWSRFLTQTGNLFRPQYDMLKFGKLLQLKTDSSVDEELWLERRDTDAENHLEEDIGMELFEL